MKTETSQNTRNQEKKTDVWIKLFPLIFILGVLPLSVHLKIVETGLETAVWFPAQSKSADFFAWWRSPGFCSSCGMDGCGTCIQDMDSEKTLETGEELGLSGQLSVFCIYFHCIQ